MLTHPPVSVVNNPAFPVSSTVYELPHLFSGGNDEDVLTRDSTQSDGSNWINKRQFRNGTYLLRDWQGATAKVVLGQTTQAVIAWIGDSWATQGNITTTLAANLKNILGDGGPGYIGANVGTPTPFGLTRTEAGSWTHEGPTGTLGLNLTDSNSLDIATPGSLTFAVSTKVTGFVIHYVAQSGGGKFTWQIDGGAATTIDTSNATKIFASVIISGLSSAAHTLKITVTVAGTAGVTINGVDCQNTTIAAARFHNLGFTGTSTADWATATATTGWQAGLTALAPNVVVILLGVNDQGAQLSTATYQANLTTMVTNIRTAMPRADVILISAGDTSTGSPPVTMAQYAAAMKAIAPALNAAYFDAYSILGDWTTANARGLYTNTTHVNAAGGQVIGDAVIRSLVERIPLLTGNYFDPNGFAKGSTSQSTATITVANISATCNFTNGTNAPGFLQWVGAAAGFIAATAIGVGQWVLENYAGDRGVVFDVQAGGDGTVIVKGRAGGTGPSTGGQLAANSVRGAAVTVANLPATPVEGMLVTVTDATATTAGSIVAGGSTHQCLVWYDGTNWRIAVGT